MATEFSRTLSLLRKERGVSQRMAAADLGVSQALLSHYENGIREPGLAFVSKVCDYYHVSADYMLGRTLARDGSMLTAEEILNAAEPSNVLQGSVLATLRGKLITSPIVMKLLGDRLPIESLTVMVQKEAADRLAAVPGTRASSAISCAVNYYATSKLMFTAAPGSFYPAPKVTSAVVRMDIRPTPAVQVEDEAGYFALVRTAFGQRRKTAANAIAGGLNLPKEKVIAAIESAGFDARIRPEALTLEDFAKLQQALS